MCRGNHPINSFEHFNRQEIRSSDDRSLYKVIDPCTEGQDGCISHCLLFMHTRTVHYFILTHVLMVSRMQTVSTFFESLCPSLVKTQLTNTVYHLQTNGEAERLEKLLSPAYRTVWQSTSEPEIFLATTDVCSCHPSAFLCKFDGL